MKIFLQSFIATLIFVSLFSWRTAEAIAQGDNATENSTKTNVDQVYFELRIYNIDNQENQKVALDYLEKLYIPALKKLEPRNVGVFVADQAENEEENHSVFVLTPFKDLNAYADQLSSLGEPIAELATSSDEAEAAFAAYMDRALKDPVYSRIDIRLMRAFKEIPNLELAEYSQNRTNRIFELRLYESHNEEFAKRKVKMFNEGEVQLMRKVEMAPVFFGETLVGSDVPNLIYMLSAESHEAHQEHWKAFLADPEWDRMKNLDEYRDTVSKIKKWLLVPAKFSDL